MTEAEREGFRKSYYQQRINMLHGAYHRVCVCGHHSSWHSDWRDSTSTKCWKKHCKCRKFTRAFGHKMVADAFIINLIEDNKRMISMIHRM